MLPPDELATLRTALERSEIATLERNYLDPRAADAYQYDVTYQGVTVTADEGVLPPSLRPVVDQLTPLIRA
ncbi:MAG TPA: protealysin inhibitor emfourin [Acidimicrobiales bacterium]|nr:protealysin inhibitor emfourin [Acidimicrobiales bacterium]